jgi:hypothetical protein
VNDQTKEYFHLWCDAIDKIYVYRKAAIHNKFLLEDALMAITNGDLDVAYEFIERVIAKIDDSMNKTDYVQKVDN